MHNEFCVTTLECYAEQRMDSRVFRISTFKRPKDAAIPIPVIGHVA